MYLIAPMDDEPPPEYVAFVTLRARDLRAEAVRLVGGDREAGERVYLDVLTETAGHWRRLRWWGRLTRTSATENFIRKFLDKRTEQWREDQVYEIRVTPIHTEHHAPRNGSMALRKAAVIPGTARASLEALADAEIAWVHAWRRSQWRHVMRLAGGAVLLVGAMIQYFSSLSTGGY
ncbi:hypothetical protein FB565_002637 [Actinoplanes lutulentus]|uniref:Uncharacterized protein n=1 Tax=Actinoplanes lutulentus TaxID=1287878 RepID=A0A327ZEB7_9ACTN|nr:hypothetical protein [Actinoplanes lutulentus]MBB2942924.1 hypothetical protein [Actinoplanes lutulentus]RAK38502.1 hypothetical protein B0I29_105450 [Actinoplanes lutulentus]